MTTNEIIDLSESLSRIREEFGERFHSEPEAQRQAANKWGFLEYNDCGVIPSQREVIVEVGGCSAEVRLAESTKGYFLIGWSAHTAVSGTGVCPNIFDFRGYASVEAAKAAATKRIVEFFEIEERFQNSCSSAANRANIREALAQLKQAHTQPEFAFLTPLISSNQVGDLNASHR